MNWPASDAPSDYQVRTRLWRNGVLEKENFPFEEISDYLAQPDALVWCDLCAPDRERLDALAEEISLDPHAVEDAVSPRERPKASVYAHHVFLTAYWLRYDTEQNSLHKTQVSAFIRHNAVVTVRADAEFDIGEVVQAWDEDHELVKYGPMALVHGLLDVLVDSHFTAVEALDDAVDDIEDDLFDTRSYSSTEIERRSFTLRKTLVLVRRAVLPMREVVAAVRRFGEHENAPDSQRADPEAYAALMPYYNDLYDHVLRASDWTESIRDMVSSIFETNLSLADARLNSIMKKLTSWAAIIAVPTAITGFYGQNVPYPGFSQHWGFFFSTLAIVLISGALYFSFKKRDWL